MLKLWRCECCQMLVLAFAEDILNRNVNTFEVITYPQNECKEDWHTFREIPSYTQSTLHGEAGFGTEGTVLDSLDSLHEHEALLTEKAADERELKQFIEAVKSM